MATGLRDALAVSAARAPSAAGSMRDQSWCDAPDHPEPLPSGVRTVVVSAAAVPRSQAKRPFVLATALEPARASRKPVDTSCAADAGAVMARTASARPCG